MTLRLAILCGGGPPGSQRLATAIGVAATGTDVSGSVFGGLGGRPGVSRWQFPQRWMTGSGHVFVLQRLAQECFVGGGSVLRRPTEWQQQEYFLVQRTYPGQSLVVPYKTLP
jgi:hypothetical protein